MSVALLRVPLKISGVGAGGGVEGEGAVMWWGRKPENRQQWVLDPLVGVGPLRFGMDSDEVRAALGAADSGSRVARDGSFWATYGDLGLTALYAPGMLLAAVEIHAAVGPRVSLAGVELMDRVPSEVSADLHRLARGQGVPVGVNWGGDPEIAAWGLSMGAVQAWEASEEGHPVRTDRAITQALVVAPELAHDPYGTDLVALWRDIREEPLNPGAWPVTADRDRARWEWTPLEGVGPLRFGMTVDEVIAALGEEEPAARRGFFPHYFHGYGQWYLEEDRFDAAGLTAHYWMRDGRPTLAAVTLHGRTGPQVVHDGMKLIGQKVTALDAALIERAERGDMDLAIGCSGDLGIHGCNMYVRSVRAGDGMVSAARFCDADWEDHG
ncbi:hypothetical protein RKD21_002453 [Streptomyces albogriseolus]|uniref:Uncharacterized protein n=1 Tax=Streptomyces albogriseolus TaxID=1887 RepID=A0ACC6ULJ3_STRAO